MIFAESYRSLKAVLRIYDEDKLGTIYVSGQSLDVNRSFRSR